MKANKNKTYHKLLCAILLVFFIGNVKAQLTGTKNIPGDYATLDLAITDLNIQGVGPGGVMLNMIAGNPETAPIGGYAITATGTAANMIIIQGNGNVITANAGLGVGPLNDAIFKIVGGDYITLTGFVMMENPANTVTAPGTNNMTEWGVALLYASVTDGAQNNNIAGNTISLDKTYANTFGVYSNVRHDMNNVVVTADITNNTTAPNSGNKVYGNLISNVNAGIVFIGSGTGLNMDMGNDIGGASLATGNTISNWGGTAAGSAYVGLPANVLGVYMLNQNNYNVSFNSVVSASLNTATGLRGILADYSVVPSGTITNTITNNTVTFTQAGNGPIQCIATLATGGVVSGVTLNVSNNNIINNAITGVGSSSSIIGVGNGGAYGTVSINNNIIRSNTSTATTAGFLGILNQGGVVNTINIMNNQIGNASGGAITYSAATSGTINGIANTSAAGSTTVNITGNSMQGFSCVTSGTFTGISNSGAAGVAVNINNNNLGTATAGLVTYSGANSTAINGISNTGGTGTCTVTISSNDIRGIVHSVAATSAHTYFTQTAVVANTTVSSNTLTNLNVNTTGAVTFINHSYSIPATGQLIINGNFIVTAFVKGGASGSLVFATTSAFSGTGSVNNYINNNFSNITVSGATTITGFNNADGGTSSAKTITGNIFNNWIGGTGTINTMNFGYWNGVSSLSNNTITNITAQGNITGVTMGSSSNAATSITVATNTITGLSSTGVGGTVTGITCSNTSTLISFTGNIINTLSSTGASSTTTGLAVTGNAPTVNISANVINTVTGSGATAPTVRGINVSTGTTVNIFKNKVYDLQAASAGGTVNGLLVSGGTTHNISNNTIGDLRTPAANAANPLIGISLTGGTTRNVYYNTVYLNATSSGAAFGSSAISASTGTTTNLRNNIFINNSTAVSTGFTVAYRRGSTILTSYANTSNNNLFYAGTPSTSNLIFNDGTNSLQTLATYQAFVTASRDAASVTENTVFLSTSGASANFLHVDGATPSLTESGAVNIATFTDDYDANIRQGNAGYAGTGSAPDIGADEYNGVNPLACTGTPTAGTVTGASPICGGTGTTLTLSGATSGPGITYQWASSAVSGGPYTNMGTASTQATGNLAATTFYVVTTNCTTSGMTATTPEFTVSVNPAPAVAVAPTTGLICNPGGAAVALTASGAVSYTWLPVAGLSATTGATTNANPTSTTTYTVTGTDGIGCTATATSVITVAEAPIMGAVTATPASVCSGGNSQLNASAGTTAAYTLSTPAFSTVPCQATAGPVGDDVVQGPNAIGFSFYYYGVNYTQFAISTNGNIQLGSGAGTANNPAYSNAWTDATIPTAGVPDNFIALAWDDWNVLAGEITWGVTGVAPNRKLVVCYNTTGRGSGSADTLNGQIVLEETTNKVNLNMIKKGIQPANTATQGIENQTGTAGSVPVPGRQVSAWSCNNETKLFTPSGGTFTYAWTPATFLNSTTINNPLASGITTTTSYTATATTAAGCAITGTVTITAGAALTSTSSITPSNTVCQGTNVTLNSVPTGGGAPYTYAWSGPNSFASTSQNPVITGATPAASGTYTITVTDNCAAVSTTQVTLTVNAAPTVAVLPTTGLICNPGGTAVPLNASGATTYAWLPATGLSVTTGASTSASPIVTTTYTVTGTDAIGCTATATSVITVGEKPGLTATATPAAVCAGGNSQLLATGGTTSAYTVSNIPFAATATPGTGVTTLSNAGVAITTLSSGSLDDGGWMNQALPFNFYLFGTSYSSFAVSTNGFMYLGAGAPNTYTGYNTAFPSATPAHPCIGAIYSDLDFRTIGTINYFTTGVAPNRTLVVNWSGGQFYNGTGALTTQIIIYETTNVIEVHTNNSTGTNNAVEGIQNIPGSVAYPVPGRNNSLWTVGTPDAYRWSPSGGTLSYLWSPSTFLSSATVANPMANGITTTTSYSVTITEATSGCTNSFNPVTVTADPLSAVNLAATPSTTVCAGTSVTINSTVSGGGSPYGYTWSSGQTTANIVVTPTVTTTYTVTVLDACAASVNNSITITVNPNPTVAVTPTTGLYCNPGTAISLAASGATTYAWLPVAGLSATTGANVDATPGSTTTYTVTGTDGNGCMATATAMITSAPAVTGLSATATPTVLCSGATTDLAVNAASPSPNILTENFNTTIPTWTLINNSTLGATPAASAWTLRPNGYLTTAGWGVVINSNDASQFILTNSDAQGSGGNTNTLLQSPAFSTAGFTTCNLSFYHFYQYWNTMDTIRVQVSTNGTNWTTVKTYPQIVDQGAENAFVQDNINLNAYVGMSTVYVRYWYKAVWGYGWAIDNVAITGTPINYTYNWSSTPAGYTSTSQNNLGVAPTVSTDYSVTVSNGSCSATTNVMVTVNPTPSAPTVPATTICSGNAATLASSATAIAGWYDAATGGNYLSGSATYVTPVLNANATYFVQDSTAAGCLSPMTQVDVIVNPTPVVSLGSDIVQCSDLGGVTLDAQNAGSTYMWSTTEATQTISTNTSGTYEVMVTDPNTCIGYDTIMVTINPSPAVAIGNDTTICGASVTLDAQNTGDTYLWNTTEATQSIVVTASGSYNVTVTDPSGCIGKDTIALIINPAPTLDLGPDAVLCGGNVLLDAQNAGSAFLWNDASTASVLFVTTSGTYWAEVTTPQNCIVRDSIDITIYAVPTVNFGPDASVCSNATPLTLDAGATAGATYLWSDASTAQTLDVTTSGTYYATATTGPGCSSSDTIVVTVNTNPAASLSLATDTACVTDGLIALSGESPTGGTFTGTSVSGANFDPSIGAGNYAILYTYTDVNGCSDTASQNMYVDVCNGAAQNVLDNVSVYPNPNKGTFYIETGESGGKVIAELFNTRGQLIVKKQLDSSSRNTMDVQELSNGFYMLRITYENHVKNFKISLTK